MRAFSDHHPIAVAVYFLSVMLLTMFSMDPVVLALSLAGGIALQLVRNGLKQVKTHGYMLLLFVGMALINPVFSHRGETVLFVVNHNPITLEALYYGLAASSMIVATLYWFRSFSQIMTSDKLLCALAFLSPKISLMLSMAMRYVPLFGQQAQKVRQAQKALGLYKENNIVDSLRAGGRIFSVMTTWALENGVITADSMTARGYGLAKRSSYSLFRWRRRDILLLFLSLLLLFTALYGVHSRAFTFYPAVSAAPMTLRSLIGYGACTLLAILPSIIDIQEALRWRCLQSNI